MRDALAFDGKLELEQDGRPWATIEGIDRVLRVSIAGRTSMTELKQLVHRVDQILRSFAPPAARTGGPSDAGEFLRTFARMASVRFDFVVNGWEVASISHRPGSWLVKRIVGVSGVQFHPLRWLRSRMT